jgi:hypothetical protein
MTAWLVGIVLVGGWPAFGIWLIWSHERWARSFDDKP